MKALVCHQLGDPLKEGDKGPLKLSQEYPRPSEAAIKPRDVRIQVIAAALNFADALQVQVWRAMEPGRQMGFGFFQTPL